MTAEHIATHTAAHQDAGLMTALEQAARGLHAGKGASTTLPPSGYDLECPHRLARESGTMIGLHPCYLEMAIQADAFGGQLRTYGHHGLDQLLHLAIAYADRWTYNLLLTVLPSVRPLPATAYDNQLRIDVSEGGRVAAIACTTIRGPQPGTWVTRGAVTKGAVTDHDLVCDYHNPGQAAFPPDAAVPGRQLYRAAHQYLDANGAGLPPCLGWQKAPGGYL